MPMYEIKHSYALTSAQQDALAQRITDLHSTMFDAPPFFVNVYFVPYADVVHYVAGKKQTGVINFITGNVRTAPNRTQEHFKKLCLSLETIWDEVITGATGTKAESVDPKARFMGCAIRGGLLQTYEQGIMLPQAGNDLAWFREQLPSIQQKADAGDWYMKEAIEQIKAHPKFKDAGVNGA